MSITELTRYIESGFSFSDEQKNEALNKMAQAFRKIEKDVCAAHDVLEKILTYTE